MTAFTVFLETKEIPLHTFISVFQHKLESAIRCIRSVHLQASLGCGKRILATLEIHFPNLLASQETHNPQRGTGSVSLVGVWVPIVSERCSYQIRCVTNSGKEQL